MIADNKVICIFARKKIYDKMNAIQKSALVLKQFITDKRHEILSKGMYCIDHKQFPSSITISKLFACITFLLYSFSMKIAMIICSRRQDYFLKANLETVTYKEFFTSFKRARKIYALDLSLLIGMFGDCAKRISTVFVFAIRRE
jgi:hypothetical protein